MPNQDEALASAAEAQGRACSEPRRRKHYSEVEGLELLGGSQPTEGQLSREAAEMWQAKMRQILARRR